MTDEAKKKGSFDIRGMFGVAGVAKGASADDQVRQTDGECEGCFTAVWPC